MRIPIGLIVLPIILSLSPSCHAWYALFTTTMDLLDYGQRLLGFLPNKTVEEPYSEIKMEFDRNDKKLVDIKNEIRGDLKQLETLIKEGLKDLAGKNSLVETQRYMQLAAHNIGDRFEVLKNTQRYLNEGEPDFLEETFQKQTHIENDLENFWSGIKSTFIDVDVLGIIGDDFITSKMVIENVCAVKVSPLQLLERLFVYFQTTSAKVFLSRHIIYNYFEKYHLEGKKDSTSKKVHATRREDYNKIFYGGYFQILGSFEKHLKNISSKVWSCDPIKFGESNYLELKAFTKYYILGIDFQPKFYGCARDCQDDHQYGPQNVLDNCMSKCSKIDSKLKYVNETYGSESKHRENTRDCSKPLADCRLKPDGTGLLYACVEKSSKTEYKRYTRVQTSDNCIYGRIALNVTADFASAYPLECVCPEKSYYISTLHTKADNGHVIVGAQIQMSKDKILYIKVKQGKPMSQGIIPITKWLDAPLSKSATQEISWGDCDEFDLSEIQLPNDRVIVGLGFTGCEKGRIHLRVTSKTFDLETGTLGDDLREEELIRGTKLYSVNNTNVPIDGRDKNFPIDLKDGDYVKLALSSLEEDAGQTTVPFIDIQEVVPAVPVALSGASLVLRTQPGYGGFLGIQVFTYNALPHMPPHKNYTQSEIDETLMNV